MRAESTLRHLNSQSGNSCVWHLHLHLPFREQKIDLVFWIRKEMVLTLPSSYCCPMSTTVTQETERPLVPPYLNLEQCSASYLPPILCLATGTFPWVNDKESFLLHLFFLALWNEEAYLLVSTAKMKSGPSLPMFNCITGRQKFVLE